MQTDEERDRSRERHAFIFASGPYSIAPLFVLTRDSSGQDVVVVGVVTIYMFKRSSCHQPDVLAGSGTRQVTMDDWTGRPLWFVRSEPVPTIRLSMRLQ
jgi:hypothetical protein